MNFKVTPHAQYRLRERGISIERVKNVILNPDKHVMQNDGSIKAVRKDLIVIYKKEKRQYVIITAYGN